MICYQSTSYHKWSRVYLCWMFRRLCFLDLITFWMMSFLLNLIVLNDILFLMLWHFEHTLSILLAIILWSHLLMRYMSSFFLKHTDWIDSSEIVIWLNLSWLWIYLKLTFQILMHIVHWNFFFVAVKRKVQLVVIIYHWYRIIDNFIVVEIFV